MRVAGILALALLAASCGTAPKLTGPPASRTLQSKSAHFVQRLPGIEREGDVEFTGRGRIVEHGPFGYREYRYMGDAWFQLGGEIGPVGEDLGGKWVRHPRGGATDDVLAAIVRAIRHPQHVTLDRRGRIAELRLGRETIAFSHYGEHVQVDAPPPDEIYVGHD